MRRRIRLPVCWLPVALAAACAACGEAPQAGAADMARFGPRGIGPLQLGEPLVQAARRALPLDPAAAAVGPGCDQRDQVAIAIDDGGLALAVMAMAGADGAIEEIVVQPRSGAANGLDAATCRRRGTEFAARFAPALGAPNGEAHRRRAVSDEFTTHFEGNAVATARWFAGGGSCDLALVFTLTTAH